MSVVLFSKLFFNHSESNRLCPFTQVPYISFQLQSPAELSDLIKDKL